MNIHRGSFDFHSYGSPIFHLRFSVIVCKQLAPSLWHVLLWSLPPAFLKGTEQNLMPCRKYPSRQLGLIFLRTTKYYGVNICYLIWCSVPESHFMITIRGSFCYRCAPVSLLRNFMVCGYPGDEPISWLDILHSILYLTIRSYMEDPDKERK